MFLIARLIAFIALAVEASEVYAQNQLAGRLVWCAAFITILLGTALDSIGIAISGLKSAIHEIKVAGCEKEASTVI